MPELIVNGQTREFAEADFPEMLEQLLLSLELKPGAIVAEVNGQIVPRQEYGSFALSEGDRVELVHFVGGG